MGEERKGHSDSGFSCGGPYGPIAAVLARHAAGGNAVDGKSGEGEMASKRGDQKPWMEAPDYGRSLRGFQVNLLVKDVAKSVAFARDVLEAQVIHADPDFAVLRHGIGPEWMVHADHTYGSHPL